MTFKDIIQICALVAVFALAISMVISYLLAARAILKIKRVILPLFTTQNFEKILSALQGMREDPPDEKIDFNIEEVMPFEMDGNLVAFFLIIGSFIYVYPLPEVISRKETKEIEYAIAGRFQHIPAMSFLNLDANQLQYLSKKFSNP